MARAVFDELARPEPRRRFTVERVLDLLPSMSALRKSYFVLYELLANAVRG